MLDPDLAEHRMVVTGDVAGGEHAGHRRLQRRPDGDATALIEPRAGQQLDARLRADPHDRDIRVDAPAAARHDRFETTVALEARDGLVEEHLHAVVSVESFERPADVAAEHPVQGGLEDLHDRDVEAEHAHRCRDLGADEAHADADDARSAGGRRLDRARHRSRCAGRTPPARSTPGTSSLRLRLPVATSRASNPTRSPPASTTSRVARVELHGARRRTVPRPHGRRTTPRDARTAPRTDCSPRRYSFESGGRSYGGVGSAPIRTTRPSNPSSRRVAAAVAPASEAPTMTNVRSGSRGLRPRSSDRRPHRDTG